MRWAVDCAERVLPLFTRCSADLRPKHALEIGRAWANGEVQTGVAMKASVEAHAAAREVSDAAAVAAARAAGQAVATAHFADHSMGALIYALKALERACLSSDEEMEIQLARLPHHLREMVATGVSVRLDRLTVR